MLKPISFYLLGTLCAFTLCRAETASHLLSGKKTADKINALPSIQHIEQNTLPLLAAEEMPPQVVAEIAVQKQTLMNPPKPSEYTARGAPPMRVGFRYTTPDGIGYKQGYSTLEAFFSSLNEDRGRWLKFIDLRGHVFDNGKMAANAGVGLRRISSSRVWGINAYYDYRNTKHQHYNQVAAGLEMLGKKWDFRLNGYLPVGDKTSHLRHTHFDKFEGNYIILRSTKDFAMRGGNMEMGRHIGRSIYVAGGPYYLNGQGATTWGGELRASLSLFDNYLRVEGNTSYDHFFKWVGQAQISLNIPFGKSRKIKCSEATCAQKKTLYQRAMQRIDRHEIIPVGKYHPESVAIDPLTDLPYFVVFVDNTSASLGTFESPYSSLAAAQANSGPNDIIYVFPGDGTPTNMDIGIALQDRQMLLGASTVHPIATTLGGVSIPAFASLMPAVTNTSGDVITLANDNLVSGMLVGCFVDRGIRGIGINNFTATQNAILGNGQEGILLTNVTGQITIDNNVFSQSNSGAASVDITQSAAQCAASFFNNTFYKHVGNGISAHLSGTGAISSLHITNNTINGNSSGTGVFVQIFDDASLSEFMVSKCNLNNCSNAIEAQCSSTQSINLISVTETNIDHCLSGITINVASSGSAENILIANSNITDNNFFGIQLQLTASGSMSNVEITDCNVNNNSFANLSLLQVGVGSSLSNFFAANSHFDRTNNQNGLNITAAQGIIGNFEMNNCTADQNAVGLNMSSGIDISNFVLSNCSFSNNSGNGLHVVRFGSGVIDNMSLSNSIISNNDGANLSLELFGSGGISNLAFTNCTVNNSLLSGLDISLASSGSIDNLLIANSLINGNKGGNGVNLTQTSTGVFGNIALSNSTISDNTHGVSTDFSSGTPSLAITDTVLSHNTNTGLNTNASVFNALEIVSCTITDVNQAGINFTGAAADLQIKDNSFSGNAVDITINPTNSIPKGIVAGNTFNGSDAPALNITTPAGSNVLSLTNNLFTNNVSNALGYAVTIANSGTLCLDFVHNTAVPVNWGAGNDPYSFTGGTINLTAESTQANNTGTINPAPGTFGSCTQ